MKSGALQIVAGGLLALVAQSSLALCSVGSAGLAAQVVTVSGGLYSYDYSVNVSPGSCTGSGWNVTSFSLPYFTDAGIGNITSPSGWQAVISNSDPFGLPGAETLTWSTAGSGIATNGYTYGIVPVGFGYLAAYAPVNAPMIEGYLNGDAFLVDPVIAGSPDALQAGLLPVASTPIPDSIWLLGGGLAVFAFAVRRRPALVAVA